MRPILSPKVWESFSLAHRKNVERLESRHILVATHTHTFLLEFVHFEQHEQPADAAQE